MLLEFCGGTECREEFAGHAAKSIPLQQQRDDFA
jgi:hypothetical protein